jgi:hypothetical protein
VSAEPLPNSAGFVETLEQPAASKIVALQTTEALTVTVPRRWFGWRETVFIVAKDELAVLQSTLLGAKRRHWSRAQLADIRVGRIIDSEGPDTPELHIQPHPGEGARFRLALRDEAEARWLATLLRRAVGLADDGSVGQRVLFRERLEQPAGSRITWQGSNEGVTLTVPPPGLAHAYVMKRILHSVIAFIGALLVGALVHFVFEDTAFCYLYAGLGSLFGLALLADAVKQACRQVVLTVAGDKMIVEQSSLYGVRREQLPLQSITDVHLGDGFEGRLLSPHLRQLARDRTDPTIELQVHLRNGKIIRLLGGYGDAELQWLATVLRRAVGVSE